MTSTILLSILANVLTDVVKFAPKTIKRTIDQELQLIDESKKELPQVITSSIQTFSDSFPGFRWQPKEEFLLFLQSEEVALIIRQVFCYSLYEEIGEERPFEISQLRSNFIIEYESFFNTNALPEERSYLENIFSALVDYSEDRLVNVLSPQLRAFESLQKFKARIEFQKLNQIQRDLQTLRKNDELHIKVILEFEQTFRDQIIEVHGKIIPPSFSDTKKLPINSVYVSPDFRAKDYSMHYEDYTLSIEEFIADIDKTLVLGNPGAGKTTLTDKLCFELASNYNAGLVGGKLLTPIHIVIRKFSEEKSKSNSSIRDFIEMSINSVYQLRPPKGAIEYMLINGRVIVIFDGLDELLEVGIRKEIISDIEAFLARYPLIKVLVTSREVGYNYAPLSQNKFQTFKIAPFCEMQIKEYVSKWFLTDNSLETNEKKSKIASFLVESQRVPDLISNPLMLSLMCILYKGEGYIPSNRPDLYEKCSKMLFETWDRRRNISSYTPFEDYFRSTLMYLAHWIYTQESEAIIELEKDLEEEFEDFPMDVRPQETGRGFSEKLILRIASDYLSEYFDTYEQSENYAQKLIDFCKNRAWVFTDVGEESYNFTHRTFLEYFAANYLVRTYTSINDLVNFISPKIAKSEWLLVSQLALQVKNQYQEKAADEIVVRLLQKANNLKKEGSHNIRLFVCSCMQFINFSTKTRIVIFDSLKALLDRHASQIRINGLTSGNEKIKAILNEIAKCNASNKNTINKSIQEYICGLVDSNKLEYIKFAILLTLDLPNLSDDEHRIDRLNWRNLRLEALSGIDTRVIESLIKSDLESAVLVSSLTGVSVDAVSEFGVDYVLGSLSHIYSRKPTTPVFSQILEMFSKRDKLPYLLKILSEIGKSRLQDSRTALYSLNLPSRLEITKQFLARITKRKSKNALMGLFWLLAILYEKGNRTLVLEALRNTDLEFIFQARNEGSSVAEFTFLEKYNLNGTSKELIVNWMNRKLKFLRIDG